MGRVIGFGFVFMPPIAATIACGVSALFSILFRHFLSPDGMNFKLLWWSALVVAVPSSILGTLICGPAVSRSVLSRSTIGTCAAVGAILGVLGLLTVTGSLDSLQPGNPRVSETGRAGMMILFMTGAITGCLSGIVFAFMASKDDNAPTLTGSTKN